jgi:type II secretory ATPase GspE/PulE/Tfp pilus assembly ATPase PilB-like protein
MFPKRHAADDKPGTLRGHLQGGKMKQKKQSPRAGKPARTSAKPTRNVGKTGKPAPVTSAERWVNLTIIQAVRERADAVHIEPGCDGLTVRFRVDGTLRPIPAPEKSLQPGVISRIKTMSRMNVAEERLPQDGRYGAVIDGREVDFRVSSFPSVYGESVVMRLLDRTGLRPIDRVGFLPGVMTKVRAMMAKPRGVILVAGPTGSGKTTVLYGIVSELSTGEKKIISIEDPVEYTLDGVTQSQVNPHAGYNYSNGLRSVLHHDPDVIMLGGIGDAETAQTALQAALTGQLVLSTIHANDAPETITRLVEMGVEPFLVATGLEGIIAMRLVRLICPACKYSYLPGVEASRVLGLKPGQKVFKGRGCAQCNNTGYKGRIGIFEVLPMTDEIRDLVVTRPHPSAVRDLARKAGVATLLEDGLEKVKAGTTTIDEVMRVTARPSTGDQPAH